MLTAADRDFVPPLSARFSPSQTAFGSTPLERGVACYFEDMYREQMLGAFEGDTLLGFVTFMEDLDSPYFEGHLPNIYICTLLVKPEARGKHLTGSMYHRLFDELYPRHNLFTRTWSTNAAHIAILSKFGFSEIARIENDRGEGIDTVYFAKRRGKL
jgi:ribosomal protein S18 acetylase RimI-like enzyme